MMYVGLAPFSSGHGRLDGAGRITPAMYATRQVFLAFFALALNCIDALSLLQACETIHGLLLRVTTHLTPRCISKGKVILSVGTVKPLIYVFWVDELLNSK